MNIIFIGYMGCGKSLIGNGLAQKKELAYIDLDTYIEFQEKKSISEIFKEKGEIYFRRQETFYLKEILSNNKNTIISLGGGTPCFAGNIDIIANSENTSSIYLQTSLEELTNRLFNERKKRPLIQHLNTLELLNDFIRKHLFERSFYYNQANFKIITDNKSVDQIIEECESLLF